MMVTDFINVASGVIATINLKNFMPAKDLSTIDMSLSDDGSRLCIIYGDGSVSVVDRNMYLRENPRRWSWAFQYSTDDGRETPLSIAASYEKPAGDFMSPLNQPQSPFVLTNVDEADTVAESVSLAGLEKKAIQRSASASAKYLPDVVPVWRCEGTVSGSCPVLSPKTAFFRVESGSSIGEEEDLSRDSPYFSRVATPGISETSDNYLTVPSALDPCQSFSQSKTCPTFSSPPAIMESGQEKVACCYFQLPYWNDKSQCRKLVWRRKQLFIWLSVHNALSVEEHIFIVFSLTSEKVFSYRLV